MQFGSKLDIGFTLVTVVIMITIIFRKEKVVLVVSLKSNYIALKVVLCIN